MDEITFWLNGVGRRPLLSQKATIEMFKLLRSKLPPAKHARIKNKIIEANLGLVANYITKYCRAKTDISKWGHHNTIDYLQVAVMGLSRAIDSYDITRGYAFSTYAMFWIRSYVGRYDAKNSSMIYVPESAQRTAYIYSKGQAVKTKSGNVVEEERVRETYELVALAKKCSSLDIPVEQGGTIIELIAEQKDPLASSDDFGPDLYNLFDKAGLSEADRTVLEQKYLLELTLKEIGDLRGVSKSTVSSQLENIMKKLRKVADPVMLSA
ncbi:MAG: sigma-70 family RNA polymerase sigma factor [bacterium]|jgi:RNA polymerase sigma-B factor